MTLSRGDYLAAARAWPARSVFLAVEALVRVAVARAPTLFVAELSSDLAVRRAPGFVLLALVGFEVFMTAAGAVTGPSCSPISKPNSAAMSPASSSLLAAGACLAI